MCMCVCICTCTRRRRETDRFESSQPCFSSGRLTQTQNNSWPPSHTCVLFPASVLACFIGTSRGLETSYHMWIHPAKGGKVLQIHHKLSCVPRVSPSFTNRQVYLFLLNLVNSCLRNDLFSTSQDLSGQQQEPLLLLIDFLLTAGHINCARGLDWQHISAAAKKLLDICSLFFGVNSIFKLISLQISRL